MFIQTAKNRIVQPYVPARNHRTFIESYGTGHKKLYNKFHEKSARILCRFHKASIQLTTELQYNFRGACLPIPQNDSSLSEDLSLPS